MPPKTLLNTKPLRTSTVLTKEQREKVKKEIALIRKRPDVKRAYITKKNNVCVHLSPKVTDYHGNKWETDEEVVIEINLSEIPFTAHDPVVLTLGSYDKLPLAMSSGTGVYKSWDYRSDITGTHLVPRRFFSIEELGRRPMMCFGYDPIFIDNLNKAKEALEIASLLNVLNRFLFQHLEYWRLPEESMKKVGLRKVRE